MHLILKSDKTTKKETILIEDQPYWRRFWCFHSLLLFPTTYNLADFKKLLKPKGLRRIKQQK